jgi:hypothetical protein
MNYRFTPSFAKNGAMDNNASYPHPQTHIHAPQQSRGKGIHAQMDRHALIHRHAPPPPRTQAHTEYGHPCTYVLDTYTHTMCIGKCWHAESRHTDICLQLHKRNKLVHATKTEVELQQAEVQLFLSVTLQRNSSIIPSLLEEPLAGWIVRCKFGVTVREACDYIAHEISGRIEGLIKYYEEVLET